MLDLDYHWFGVAALLVASGIVFLYQIRRINRRAAASNLAPHLIYQLRRPIFSLLVLLSAEILLRYPRWPNDDVTLIGQHVLNIGFILLGGWAVIQLLQFARNRTLKWYDINSPDNFLARKAHTRIGLLYRIASFMVVLITLALVMTTFQSVTTLGKSLLASAGVAGIIIGVAAQKTIGAVFAGIQIAITQPIRIEDAVVVEGEWGWVEEITLTYVVIRIWDKRRLIVPITYFTEKPFQNWTRQDAEIIGSVIIHTDYSVPMDLMRAELDRLLELTPLWNRKVKVLQVVDTTPREVQVRALMTARDSPTAWDLRCFVREGLIAWLQKNYPHALPRTYVSLESEISGEEKTDFLPKSYGNDTKL
jgi:small-conductance mechanosensitive channel